MRKIHLSPQRILFFLFCFLLFTLRLSSDIRFTDVTKKYGVGGYDYHGGHGVNWVDVNGDGKLDIYVKNVAAFIGKKLYLGNILFINYGDYFIDEAVLRGAADAYDCGTHGAVFADLDNDGDFDLFSTTTFREPPARNHIYLNNGNGFFTDVTNRISPPQEISTSARGVAAADFNGDGDIDLFFSNALENTDPFNPVPFPPQVLDNFYINHGNATFFAEQRGIAWTGFVQGVVAIDMDGDRDIDIAEASWTPPSTIYLNDGKGNFRDAGAELGLPQTLGVRDGGMTFADLDNDGDLDLVVAGSNGVSLYKNTGNFFALYQTIDEPKHNFAPYQTIDEPRGHVCCGDFDQDGDLDLYISGGNVYKNDGLGYFSLVPSSISGLDSSLNMVDPRGAALGDFDQDGDLDIYVTDADTDNLLFRNDTNDSNFIEVDIVDDGTGAIGGIGVKLDLFLAGHLNEPQFLRGHREIHGEYGYLGQDMPIAHFGAPASNKYDLKITFLDGVEKHLRNISSGQKYRLTYPYIYAPLNFTGVRKENKALFYRESLILLNWERNPQNENIQKYRLYSVEGAERILFKEFDANTFSYLLRNAKKNKQHRFALTAVDDRNREGQAAYVAVD